MVDEKIQIYSNQSSVAAFDFARSTIHERGKLATSQRQVINEN